MSHNMYGMYSNALECHFKQAGQTQTRNCAKSFEMQLYSKCLKFFQWIIGLICIKCPKNLVCILLIKKGYIVRNNDKQLTNIENK